MGDESASKGDTEHFQAAIDYLAMPPGQAGKWVVVRKSDKHPLGFGNSLEEALGEAGVTLDDLNGIVVGRVPG
jgi:hypothetical protein